MFVKLILLAFDVKDIENNLAPIIEKEWGDKLQVKVGWGQLNSHAGHLGQVPRLSHHAALEQMVTYALERFTRHAPHLFFYLHFLKVF